MYPLDFRLLGGVVLVIPSFSRHFSMVRGGWEVIKLKEWGGELGAY